MTRARCTMIVALASWTFLAGCSKKTEVANQETATTHETTTHETAATSDGVPADSARVAAPTGMLAAAQPVDLSGNLGCGHCTFHVKNECSLAMKTYRFFFCSSSAISAAISLVGAEPTMAAKPGAVPSTNSTPRLRMMTSSAKPSHMLSSVTSSLCR